MSYFIGKSYFEEDGVQNYLGLSDEVIKHPDNTLASTPGYDSKIRYLVFNGGSLKQDEVTYSHEL